MENGFFITLEGGEGAGKSTQLQRLGKALTQAGHRVVLTREPGGAPGAEAVRELLVTGEPGRWSPLAEALLFAAARDEHLRATIRPALAAGAVVVSDRFADSTRAYQGAGGGLEAGIVDALEHWVVGPTRPDLTIILDLEPGAGLQRAGRRGGGSDRFERHGAEFHARLRAAFLDIATADPGRCVIVDAARPEDVVASEIARLALARLAAKR
jgi:dTMP kinase